VDNKSFCTIIVVIGTAGCLLANRLSKNSNRSALLIEACNTPRNLWTPIPAGVSRLMSPGQYNWGFHTAAEPELRSGQINAPRGGGSVGTNLINGTAFFRCRPEDYNSWKDLGRKGAAAFNEKRARRFSKSWFLASGDG
jgi:choline dehydrogenase